MHPAGPTGKTIDPGVGSEKTDNAESVSPFNAITQSDKTDIMSIDVLQPARIACAITDIDQQQYGYDNQSSFCEIGFHVINST
jgi:hypothetical protein